MEADLAEEAAENLQGVEAAVEDRPAVAGVVVLLDLIPPPLVDLPRLAQLFLGPLLDLRSRDLGPHSPLDHRSRLR